MRFPFRRQIELLERHPFNVQLPRSPEVVLTFLLREEFACFCDSFEQRVEGAGLHARQVRFEFGKCHFDGVQIRAVRRQEDKLVSLRLQVRLCDCGFM